MPIAAPAPSPLPAPVPAQVAAPFARATPALTQDWRDAMRAAPALNAPALTTPTAERTATTAPAPDVQSAPEIAQSAPAPDVQSAPAPKTAPSHLARLWSAIKGIAPQGKAQATAKTQAPPQATPSSARAAAPVKTAPAPTAPAQTAPTGTKPTQAAPQFSHLRAPSAGFKDGASQADRFMTPPPAHADTPSPAAVKTPAQPPALFSQIKAPVAAFTSTGEASAFTAKPATSAGASATTPRTPQDWGATPRQAPDLYAPVKTASTPTEAKPTQVPSPATQTPKPAASTTGTMSRTPQDWGATPRQAPDLRSPVKTTLPARTLTDSQPPLRQSPSLASQVLGQAAPLQGTTPRTPQDWGATPRQAPDLYAPVKIPTKALDIPFDHTRPPEKSPPLYVPLNSVIDARQPGKLIGSSYNTSIPFGAESPVLPGGKLVMKAANVDTTQPGTIASPQIDIVAVDKQGGAQGHIRVNRDTNSVTGSIHLGDGRRDLVFTGTANPVNSAAGALQITGLSDNIGLRVVLNNPGAASTATGAPGLQGKRVELLAAPGGGGFVRNGPNLRKPIEAYVFATKTSTPGSAATTGSEGVGVRFSDLNISPQGELPVVGSAQIEVARQHGTNRQGRAVQGGGAIGVSVSADLKIGKNGGVQGFIEPSITLDPTSGRTVNVSGFAGVLIPLP